MAGAGRATVLRNGDHLLAHVYVPHNLLGIDVCRTFRLNVIPGQRREQKRVASIDVIRKRPNAPKLVAQNIL
jgi:hypothetical protein